MQHDLVETSALQAKIVLKTLKSIGRSPMDKTKPKNKPDEMQGAFSLFSVSCRDYLDSLYSTLKTYWSEK
jgi:hypothetical protein